MTHEAVLEGIEDSYRSVTGRAVRDVRATDDLLADLQLDSLQAMELLIEIEQRYGIQIVDQTGPPPIRTVDELVNLVLERTHADA